MAEVDSTGTTAIAAVPSSATVTGPVGPAGTAPSASAWRPRSATTARLSSPSSLVHSTTATGASSSGSASRSSVPSVLSYPSGRLSRLVRSRLPSPMPTIRATATSRGSRATSHAVRRRSSGEIALLVLVRAVAWKGGGGHDGLLAGAGVE